MDTTENNKIIAKFIGYKEHVNEGAIQLYIKDKIVKSIGQLNFHTDWNWLMEVVEKIESLKSQVIIQGSSFGTICNIRHFKGVTDVEFKFQGNSETSKLEAVYNACVEFIKWYEQNK